MNDHFTFFCHQNEREKKTHLEQSRKNKSFQPIFAYFTYFNHQNSSEKERRKSKHQHRQQQTEKYSEMK